MGKGGYCSITFLSSNKREMMFDVEITALHERNHAVVRSDVQDMRKTWDWWGPPSCRTTVEDVYRFCEAYVHRFGRYQWGPGGDPSSNSCQSLCRNFELEYKTLERQMLGPAECSPACKRKTRLTPRAKGASVAA